jgi:chromosome segregation ATPase
MGKLDCDVNKGLIRTIEENNRQTRAAREALKHTVSTNTAEIETLKDELKSLVDANIDLAKEQADHEKTCPECRKVS